MMNKLITSPLEIEVAPGKTVGDLTSAEECRDVIFALEMDMESIQAQIAAAEAEPGSAQPGWRSRAQAAIRWKKRAKTAVHEFARRFDPPKPPAQQRLQALCDVILSEQGKDNLDRLMARAKAQRPEAFVENPRNDP